MITHGNFLSMITSANTCLDTINGSDTTISYLPLPHIYEHGIYWYSILKGMKLGIFNGDIKKLKSDLQALKPTFFPSVPRFFNVVYDLLQTSKEY